MQNNSEIFGNIDAMIRLTVEFPAIRIFGSLAEWRVCDRSKVGEVVGIWEDVRRLATDGVSAFFLRGDGTVVYGHITSWVEDKDNSPAASVAGGRRPKVLSVRQEFLQNLVMED